METKLEQYLKDNPDQYLVNPKYRIEYARSLEEVDMALRWVINEHHPKGKWRVSRIDGQLCRYFSVSFEEALKALQTPASLINKQLYNHY